MKIDDINDINDEKSLIAFGDDFFEKSAKAKRRKEQQWLLNLAFISGDQLVSVNRHTGRFDRVDTEHDPEWVVRIVDNRTLPVYRTMVAKLTKNKPRPTAKANSKEESDIQAARAAIKLEENHWNTLEMDVKHPELVAWIVACGNAFVKQYWNPKKGDRVIDLPAEIEEIAGELAGEIAGEATGEATELPGAEVQAEIAEPVDFTLGDTDLLVRSPFNAYPQPGKTKMREMKMFGDAEIMDIDEIEFLYGKEVQPEGGGQFVRVHQNVEGVISRGKDEKKPENTAVVKELYVLPCTKFSEGIKIIWANDTLLHTEPCSEIPITHIGLIDIPGQFWFKDIIEDVVPIQRRWNALLSKIEMHNDFYNDPPVIVDPDYIDINQWTTEPGQIIEQLKPDGPKPWVMPVPVLDAAVFKELDILDQQFEIVPILHKVSYGKDTQHAQSGVAINFLQEKDDDIIRPLIESIEAGYADIFKRDFKLCQDNYQEDRGFAIVGADNETEWIEFKRANLDAGIDVGVEPGSAMPRSKAAQQGMVLNMLREGFFTDPSTGSPDYAKALKYMEFGSVNDIYEEAALDSNQAKRENERMKEGDEPIAEAWHNHQAHTYEHNRFRKTAEYENQPPQIQVLFAAHIEQHEGFTKTKQAEPQQQEIPMELIEQALAHMEAANPEEYARLMAMPEEQRMQLITELLQQQQQAQQQQMPQQMPQQQIPGPQEQHQGLPTV